MKFLSSHFDKFLLSFFVIYFSVIGWHAVYHIDTSSPFEQSFMAAMLDNQKLVIGALLGLITGAAVRAAQNERATDKLLTPPPPPVIDSPGVPVAPVSAPIPTTKAPGIGPPMPHQ